MVPKSGQLQEKVPTKGSQTVKRTPKGRWLKDKRARVTRPYGVSGNYALGWHTGVDLAVPGAANIPIVWAMKRSCEVVRIGSDPAGFGTYLVVRGHNGNEWLFGHMSHVAVRPGQRVPNGGLLGHTGASGNATGDHLHLERSRSGAWRYGHVKRPPVFDY